MTHCVESFQDRLTGRPIGRQIGALGQTDRVMLTWTISKGGGPKRVFHAAVAVRNTLYSFGGYCEGGTYNHMEQMDVHVFNTVPLCWKKLPPVITGRGGGHLEVPSRRWGHTAVLVEDTVYIWGGCSGVEYYNVLYAFDVDAHRWFKHSRVSGAVPEARMYHSACVLGEIMFIHGGWTNLTECTNDMYKLDTSTMVWSSINTRGTPYPPSGYHSATMIGTKMFVFGGAGYFYYNIGVFDTVTDLWLNTPSTQLLPERRYRHSAFPYNGELYIFGGDKGDQLFNDLWKYNPETFSWKKVEPKGKGPDPMYGMCCCMMGDRIIVHGGYKQGGYADKLYILDVSPSLKKLCKLAVIQYHLDQSELPHDIRWELLAMTTNSVLTQ